MFRNLRDEVLSEYAEELAASGSELWPTSADVARLVKNYWVHSDLRLRCARSHQEDRARAEGHGHLWDQKTGDVLCQGGRATRETDI